MIQISEQLVNCRSKETILNNLMSRKPSESDHPILDNPGELAFELLVPLYLKGNPFNMLIPSRIEMEEHKVTINLRIYCSITKPILTSLLLGSIGFALFQLLYSQLIFSIILSTAASLLQFTHMFIAIKKRSQEYLREITKDTRR